MAHPRGCRQSIDENIVVTEHLQDRVLDGLSG